MHVMGAVICDSVTLSLWLAFCPKASAGVEIFGRLMENNKGD